MSLDDDTVADLEAFVRDRLAADRLPGLSLAVVDADGLLYAEGFGSRDLAANDPATPDTLYGIGSVTKSFTSLAVAMLADRGLLDVDDPLTDHVPFPLETPGDEPVRLHHLLSHSSGLPSLGVSEALIARRTRSGETGLPLGSRADVRAHLAGAGDELLGPPGEAFAYCNTGYILLGEVVEAVDPEARSYAAFVEEEILDPLGMERATFDEDAFDDDDDRMTPYVHGDDPEAAPLPARPLTFPTGGILASVRDLAPYLRLHLRGGEINGRRLASESELATAHEGHVDTPSGRYGYGWRRRSVAGETVVGHGGSIGVSSAYAGFLPERDLGVALLCNTSPPDGLAPVGLGAVAALLGADPASLPHFEREAAYGRFSGDYETYRGVQSATVSERGGALELEVEGTRGSRVVELVPADGVGSDGEFYAVTAGGDRKPARFVDDGDGVHLRYDRRHFHQL